MRLVASDGQQVGITPLPEALQMARDLDLDLVEVAPLANPPVCRIMDYGKYKYEEAQRAKESRRKSSAVSIKEMKYRPKIGIGDFDTKTRKVSEFLSEGHKVKVTIMFRGREVFHPELGTKILDQVAEQVVGGRQGRDRTQARRAQHDDGPRARQAGAGQAQHRRTASCAGARTDAEGTATDGAGTGRRHRRRDGSAAASAAAAAPGRGGPAPEAVVVADSDAAPTA